MYKNSFKLFSILENHEGIDKEKVENLLIKYPIFETTSPFKFWNILP